MAFNALQMFENKTWSNNMALVQTLTWPWLLTIMVKRQLDKDLGQVLLARVRALEYSRPQIKPKCLVYFFKRAFPEGNYSPIVEYSWVKLDWRKIEWLVIYHWCKTIPNLLQAKITPKTPLAFSKIIPK